MTCHPGTHVVALDVGQSGSRFAVADAAGVRRGEAPPLVAGRALVPALAEIVAAALVAGEVRGPVDVIAIGATGLNGRIPPVRELHDRIAPTSGTTRLALADDSVTSYLGALGEQAGAVVAAGTGAVALASDGRALAARTDGAGYLLGDAGSGYWIGRAALESAVRERDGRGGSAALSAAAEREFGGLDELPERLAGRDDRVAAIASFARTVADLAHEGDEAAGGIWRSAAEELAASAAAALARCGLDRAVVEVALTGSLRRAGPLLLRPFDAALSALCPGAASVPPRGDALDGAIRLASASLDPFPLLAVSTGG